MIDYLAGRQSDGLNSDRSILNAKLATLAGHFGIEWLTADGRNPLQKLWGSKYALATYELLNLGDAIQRFQEVDSNWLTQQVTKIKTGDDGNRAGAIAELLALNLFRTTSNNIRPARENNPGYDGIVELPDNLTMLISIKNHGTTSYERFFRQHAKELDNQFIGWLKRHSISAEMNVLCQDNLGPEDWVRLKKDVRRILDGQIEGTANGLQMSGQWHVVLKSISPIYAPISSTSVSSILFITAREHRNEQAKFIEDLRKGCSNLVKHTRDAPNNALRVLFVRLGANASIQQCRHWALDYFAQFPREKVGSIILYQAAVVTSGDQSSFSHYFLLIEGPQYGPWSQLAARPGQPMFNLSILVGDIISEPSRKVIQTDNGQFPLDGMYTYQRGDIYRTYKLINGQLQCNLSNPAPGINIHAEIGDQSGASAIVQMIVPEQGELLLFP